MGKKVMLLQLLTVEYLKGSIFVAESKAIFDFKTICSIVYRETRINS